MHKYLLLILFILKSPLAFASLRPVLVTTTPQAPASLIFAREKESAQQAFERLALSLDQNSSLRNTSGINQSIVTSYSENNSKLETIVVMANNSADFGGEAKRMRNLKSSLQDSSTQVIQIPVGLLSIYNESEKEEVKKWINKNSKIMVVPGGDDLDPSLYSEKRAYSRNTNLHRDLQEAELVNSYMNYKKGFILGICRGHQLISSLLGYKLIQDIPIQTGTEVKHADDWHPIKLQATRKNILAKILNLNSDSELMVNSLHHQSVIYRDGGPLELAGTTSDKTTEALEFKNGHGLTLQFHPEYMDNADGNKILSGIKAISVQNWKSCKSQFR